MDVYLVKRYDLIPNLVETVKGYAKHERETLDAVIRARNAAQSSGTIDEKIANENVLAGTLGKLFALAEAYPDLKANANFMDLQGQLKIFGRRRCQCPQILQRSCPSVQHPDSGLPDQHLGWTLQIHEETVV